MMQINLENGKQAGNGQCTITADDGAQAFAVWSCRGVHLLGCDGKLMLIGGTKRVAGIAGSGFVTVRTTSRELTKMASDSDFVSELGTGLFILRDFKYKVPSK